MTRLRQYSELGWYGMQLLGSLALPAVALDEVKRKGARATLMASRAAGKAQSLRQAAERLHSRQRELLDQLADAVEIDTPGLTVTGTPPHADTRPCEQCETLTTECYPYGWLCEDCYWRLPDGSSGDREARPEVYAALKALREPMLEALWWLSYADDHRCAGVVILKVTGDQTLRHAAATAERLGLAPKGDWQVAGTAVPEEERAAAERYAGRFLTVEELRSEEAQRDFGAQRVGDFEGANPGVTVELPIVEPGRDS